MRKRCLIIFLSVLFIFTNLGDCVLARDSNQLSNIHKQTQSFMNNEENADIAFIKCVHESMLFKNLNFLIKDCLTQVENADGISTVAYDINFSDKESRLVFVGTPENILFMGIIEMQGNRFRIIDYTNHELSTRESFSVEQLSLGQIIKRRPVYRCYVQRCVERKFKINLGGRGCSAIVGQNCVNLNSMYPQYGSIAAVLCKVGVFLGCTAMDSGFQCVRWREEEMICE